MPQLSMVHKSKVIKGSVQECFGPTLWGWKVEFLYYGTIKWPMRWAQICTQRAYFSDFSHGRPLGDYPPTK